MYFLLFLFLRLCYTPLVIYDDFAKYNNVLGENYENKNYWR